MNILIKKLLRENLLSEDANDIVMSFNTLIKYNGGLFKSDKQAIFLLKMCQGPTENGLYVFESIQHAGTNRYETNGGVHDHSFGKYELRFVLDKQGILKKFKKTKKGEELQWERNESSKLNSEKNVEKRTFGKVLNNFIEHVRNEHENKLEALDKDFLSQYPKSGYMLKALTDGSISKQEIVNDMNDMLRNAPQDTATIEEVKTYVKYMDSYAAIKNEFDYNVNLWNKALENKLTPEEKENIINKYS